MSRKKTDKDKAVDMAKKVAKERDGWRCVKCGRHKDQIQIHGAHIMPVTWGGTAADPENIIALCAGCHSMGSKSAHQDPIQFGRWFDDKYPGRYDKMRQLALEYSKNPIPKKDWIEIRKELKKIYENLLENN